MLIVDIEEIDIYNMKRGKNEKIITQIFSFF